MKKKREAVDTKSEAAVSTRMQLAISDLGEKFNRSRTCIDKAVTVGSLAVLYRNRNIIGWENGEPKRKQHAYSKNADNDKKDPKQKTEVFFNTYT